MEYSTATSDTRGVPQLLNAPSANLYCTHLPHCISVFTSWSFSYQLCSSPGPVQVAPSSAAQVAPNRNCARTQVLGGVSGATGKISFTKGNRENAWMYLLTIRRGAIKPLPEEGMDDILNNP